MSLRPLWDKVLVERDEPKQMEGRIHLPDSVQEKSMLATVIAVGCGRRLDEGRVAEPEVKRGDHIMVGKYQGSEVEHEDRTFLIIKESEILAVLELD